jgi:uncharacterized membrane protein YjfL (UPF0719 family)
MWESLTEEGMEGFRIAFVVNAAIFALVGLALFFAAFAALGRLTPYDVWAEIVEKQNLALAILMGALSLGLSVIIAAAVH